ncbi:MAG TPA: protoporphyrinogen oxidase, partial [Candidatus Nanopelagicales bacterium]|nr:protoporphyrinogen oxidase [Candidatus Nanopelagicales bacterium]
MDASPTGRRIAVVGAGISGLAAARAVLAREPGARVSVLESAGRIGGVVAAAQLAGLVVDTGADRLLAHRPAATDLARDVGLEPDLQAPATLPRSLLSGGALVRLPARGISGIPTDLAEVARSGVLDRAALARLPLDHVLARTGLEEDVAVGAYVRARLGRAVVDRLVAPLLAEVHAADVDSLSMRATMPALYAAAGRDRSLLRAARVVEADTPPGPRHLGLRGGLSRLPAALAAAVVERGGTLRLGTTVRALTRTGTGWRLVLGSAADPDQLTVDSVVLAVPAAAAGRLLAPVSAPAAAILREVRHASVATVTLAYRSSELTGPGVDPLPARDDGGFVVASDGT